MTRVPPWAGNGPELHVPTHVAAGLLKANLAAGDTDACWLTVDGADWLLGWLEAQRA